MTTAEQAAEDGAAPGRSDAALTGRDRLISNVIWSWAGHIVFVISGFLMPRLIDTHVGQVSLGVWDFCWSIVSYLSLANLGIGSSVNRYVAHYRAAGEHEQLSRSVSSVFVIQLVIGGTVLIASLLLAWYVPQLFSERLHDHIEDTRWVVAFLGASVAVQMGFDSFRGVITGCHRWDLHNGIQSGSYALTVLAMLLSLHFGGNIASLAVVYFIGALGGEILRATYAMRVCPELTVSPRLATWKEARKMASFGSKTLILALPPIVALQTVAILITASLGPAALAVLSRPLGLVRHLETFLGKFTHVLGPIFGSLHLSGSHNERRELFLDSARWGIAFALPSMMMLALLGDSVLALWMGDNYVYPGLMMLLAGGLFLSACQGAAFQALIGMNAHGRVAIFNILLTVATLLVGSLIMQFFEWTLTRAAILICCALVPPYGFVVPIYACRKLQVPLGEYLRRVFLAPFLCSLPLLVTLVGVRHVFEGHPAYTMLVGGALGTLVIVAVYWAFFLTPSQRDRVRGWISGLLHRRSEKGA
jgi:O-antigen/teichoic acid export membrane protein